MKKIFNSGSIAISIVCCVLGVIIAWQYLSVNKNEEMMRVGDLKLTEVQDELIAQKNNNDVLRQRLEEVQAENNRIKNEEVVEKQLKADLKRVSMLAGITDVSGSGLIITVAEKVMAPDDLSLLEIVNDLRAAGAQAISINGERIVANSEITMAGNYIVINGQRTLPPFEIKAIGKPTEMERSITMLGGLKDTMDPLLDFKIEKQEHIEITAVRDDGTVLKTDWLTLVENEDGESE